MRDFEGSREPEKSGGEISLEPVRVQPIPVAVDDRSFFRLVPQFVIFPLILVTVAVLLVVFFGSARDDRTVGELLTEIQTGFWQNTRNQAAYELACRAQELERVGSKLTREETQRLISIRNQFEANPMVREYVTAVLGRAGDPSLALPVLTGILESPNLPEKERIHAIRGLGLSRSPEAVGPLEAELERFRAVEEWEPRLITLTALANIALSPQVDKDERDHLIEVLVKHVEDPHWMVSWNVAAILASEFRNRSGVKVLRNLLDRNFLRERLPHRAHQDQWIRRATQSLADLGGEK